MPYFVRTLLITVPPAEAAEAVEQHHQHLRELHAAGKLKAAGALDGEDGFVEILDVVDLHEAEALTGASPLVQDGLASWILREWQPIEFSS